MSFNEENFPELPETWLPVKVGEVHSSISNFEKLKTQDYLVSGQYPVIDQGGKFIGGYSNDASKVVLNDNPVIVFGDHTRNLKFVDFPFIVGADGTKILQPSEIINPKTFFYFLRAVSLPDRGYGRHFQYLRESQIPLPSLAEQIRIADKLDALLSRVNAGRERLERVPKLVKRLRQSVLSAAVSGELTREWRGGGDAEWERHLLKDHVAIIDPNPSHRYPDYQDGTVPILSTEQMRGESSWELLNTKLVNEEFFKSRQLNHGFFSDDIIFARKGRLGLARFAPKLGRYVFSHTVFILRCDKSILSPEFLRLLLLPNSVVRWLLIEMNSNTGVPTLGKAILGNLPVMYPPLPEQAEIVRRVEALFALVDRLEARAQAALTRYSRLTPALLAKAFRGELVPQYPTDEPASALLERIQAQREAAGPVKKAGGRGRKLGATTPRAEAGAQAEEAQSEPKRGRGRPRKPSAEATGAGRIPLASSQEEAMRLLQERARAEREGRETVQAGLFGD